MSKLKRAKKLVGKTISVSVDDQSVVLEVEIYPAKSDLFKRQDKPFLGVKIRRSSGVEQIFKLSSRLNCRIR